MAAHAQQPFDLSPTESPTYLARAVVALATDPNVMDKSGSVLTVGLTCNSLPSNSIFYCVC
jgi:hypothetical protein